MTKIKTCGMFRREDILAVNEAGPDFGGFIINVPKSHRNLTPDQVRILSEKLDPRILPVGVFVNPDEKLVEELLLDGTIAMAQLHGQESDSFVRRLQSRTGKPVIKAFRIRKKEDIWEAQKSSADYILLDQGCGSGIPFDWNLISGIERPWFLAGGLTADNLEEAITRLRPWAVDLSSGLERDGRKDPGKIRQAVQIVKNRQKQRGEIPCLRDDLESMEASTFRKL